MKSTEYLDKRLYAHNKDRLMIRASWITGMGDSFYTAINKGKSLYEAWELAIKENKWQESL